MPVRFWPGAQLPGGIANWSISNYTGLIARLFFESGLQGKWLRQALSRKEVTVAKIANLCNVSERTIRDWLREKFHMSSIAANLISNKYKIALPTNVKFDHDYWYGRDNARKGALARLKIYGPPGTKEGRVKGGKISQQRRRLTPENYKNCKIAKNFQKLLESNSLAELVGIILGDGGITSSQLKITLNKESEYNYINYISNLELKVFGERPKLYASKKDQKYKAVNLVLTGVNLISNLNDIGLHCRNKVKEQVSVPKWITTQQNYSLACLRGLIDTDGGIFTHKHGKNLNLGLTFTSHSIPLLNFVLQIFLKVGYHAKLAGDGIYLYRESEVVKYAREIRFSNNHHIERLNNYIKTKGRSIEAVQRACLESKCAQARASSNLASSAREI